MYKREKNWLRNILLLLVAIVVVVSSIASFRPAFAQATPANFDAVDEYISSKMEELGIPGAALVIVQGDQIVHLKAFGIANASGRPVTPQTPFFTGSTLAPAMGVSYLALIAAAALATKTIKSYKVENQMPVDNITCLCSPCIDQNIAAYPQRQSTIIH